MIRRSSHAARFAGLSILLVAVLVLSMRVGPMELDAGEIRRGIAALLGLADPLDGARQAVVELRVWRAVCTSGVGAALALSGAMIQGMFRNPLASPSLIGVTGGASLGAAVAILLVGGYAPYAVIESTAGVEALSIPLFSFLGALGTTALVALIASSRGRTNVTSLLLVGIAVNLCVAGIFAALQYLSLEDWEVSKAILAWTFGTLDDRSSVHCWTVWTALGLSATAIPFLGRELDLMRAGEDDAQALGVDVARTKRLALIASALAASAAVAVAGQIGFVGLLVPHMIRLTGATTYRALLWMMIPAGALFLTGTDLLQRVLLGDGALQPGVMMSLIGGPFFLFLIARHRREISTW